MKHYIFTFLFTMLFSILFLFGCDADKKLTSWNVADYIALEDIVRITEIEQDDAEHTLSYKIRYKSDDCEVNSFLSIPEDCLDEKVPQPCIIFNRGGNRSYGAMNPQQVARMSQNFNRIVFASNYRGVNGGTGRDEFGGADVNDVIKLIDLCEEFAFIDSEQIYMIGSSRGGMMTYRAIRQDNRIRKAVVISGLADAFMSYEEREDMRAIYKALVGDTPDNIPKEYEKRSATYWADELKCPVLIFHSKLDPKVSYAQAEKMAACLEEAGMEYQFVSYEDDVHGSHPEDFETILEWLQ